MVDISKKIAVLRCKEEDLKHNLQTLYENQVEIVTNMPCVIGRGNYFYITMYEQEKLNYTWFKGEFL